MTMDDADDEPQATSSIQPQADGGMALGHTIFRRYVQTPGLIPLGATTPVSAHIERMASDHLPLLADLVQRWPLHAGEAVAQRVEAVDLPLAAWADHTLSPVAQTAPVATVQRDLAESSPVLAIADPVGIQPAPRIATRVADAQAVRPSPDSPLPVFLAAPVQRVLESEENAPPLRRRIRVGPPMAADEVPGIVSPLAPAAASAPLAQPLREIESGLASVSSAEHGEARRVGPPVSLGPGQSPGLLSDAPRAEAVVQRQPVANGGESAQRATLLAVTPLNGGWTRDEGMPSRQLPQATQVVQPLVQTALTATSMPVGWPTGQVQRRLPADPAQLSEFAPDGRTAATTTSDWGVAPVWASGSPPLIQTAPVGQIADLPQAAPRTASLAGTVRSTLAESLPFDGQTVRTANNTTTASGPNPPLGGTSNAANSATQIEELTEKVARRIFHELAIASERHGRQRWNR